MALNESLLRRFIANAYTEQMGTSDFADRLKNDRREVAYQPEQKGIKKDKDLISKQKEVETMGFDKEELARQITKKASDSNKTLSVDEVTAIANDDFFSGLFSVQNPSPHHDEVVAQKIEDYFKSREGEN